MIGEINVPICVKSICAVTHNFINPGAILYNSAHIFTNPAITLPISTIMSMRFCIICMVSGFAKYSLNCLSMFSNSPCRFSRVTRTPSSKVDVTCAHNPLSVFCLEPAISPEIFPFIDSRFAFINEISGPRPSLSILSPTLLKPDTISCSLFNSPPAAAIKVAFAPGCAVIRNNLPTTSAILFSGILCAMSIKISDIARYSPLSLKRLILYVLSSISRSAFCLLLGLNKFIYIILNAVPAEDAWIPALPITPNKAIVSPKRFGSFLPYMFATPPPYLADSANIIRSVFDLVAVVAMIFAASLILLGEI